jgi:hypothetical protein
MLYQWWVFSRGPEERCPPQMCHLAADRPILEAIPEILCTKYIIMYRVPQCMSPRRNWDPPTPSPASQCAPPPEPKGGAGGRTLAGERVGESQFQRLEKRLSTLSNLCFYVSGSAL